MLEEHDARRSAASVSRYAAELALPAFAAAILMIFAASQTHGAGRIATAIAVLAVVAHAAIGLVRASRAAEREAATKAAMAGAVVAIEGASRATTAVLGLVQDGVIPPLNASLSVAKAMTSDRRLSASVRGRASSILTASERALAILQDIAGASRENIEPVKVAAPVEAPSQTQEPVADAPCEPARMAPNGEALDGLRVLVGEANGVHQLVLRTQLAQFGVEPMFVADGLDAIEAWRSEGWDLILLDLQMPRMDGLETARMIRSVETRFGWASTPILGLTASVSAGQQDACAEAGMSGCVAKPIDGEALFSAIEAALAAPTQAAAELPVRMARAA